MTPLWAHVQFVSKGESLLSNLSSKCIFLRDTMGKRSCAAYALWGRSMKRVNEGPKLLSI